MSAPKWGEHITYGRRYPDGMEEARARACRWCVSSSLGLLALCTSEAAAAAVAAALGADTGERLDVGPEPEPTNVDRRQLAMFGGKVA